MRKQKKKLLKIITGAAGLVLCVSLFCKCQIVSLAYTAEEIEAAKQWLIQHGYSPDEGGANQAYQDYLNGKFDNNTSQTGETNGQDTGAADSEKPNANAEAADSEKPNANAEATDSEKPNGNAEAADSEKTNPHMQEADSKDKPNKTSASDTIQQEKRTEETSGVSEGNQKDTSKTEPTSQKEGDSTGTSKSDETVKQKEALSQFVIQQLAEDNSQNENKENREEREKELYEQSLPASDNVSENSTTEKKDQESREDISEKKEGRRTAFLLWFVVSVVAVLVLGGICIFMK